MGFQSFSEEFWKPFDNAPKETKTEYHPRPCFEELTSATNLIVRQIQRKAARKAFWKDKARAVEWIP